MTKMYLKGANKLDDLMNFIEQNDYKSIQSLVKLYPETLKRKCFDEVEPIYFAIRNKANKIFHLFLINSKDIQYNIPYMLQNIIEEGTPKMLKAFIDYYKLDLLNPVYKPYLTHILSTTNDFYKYLINETNIQYTLSIPSDLYTKMGYSCPSEDVNTTKRLTFNKKEDGECYDLDVLQTNDLHKRDMYVSKYEKLFVVMKKESKIACNLNEENLKEIMKYI